MDGDEDDADAVSVLTDDAINGAAGVLATEAVAEYLLEHKHLAAAFELYQARSVL